MNKTELDYMKERVKSVTRCTIGTIHSKLNTYMVNPDLTFKEKFEMITNGKATLLPIGKLKELDGGYRKTLEVLIDCFDYPQTPKQLQMIAYNRSIENQIESLEQEIYLESNRILDSYVMGILKKEDVPRALEELGEMTKEMVVPPAFAEIKVVPKASRKKKR